MPKFEIQLFELYGNSYGQKVTNYSIWATFTFFLRFMTETVQVNIGPRPTNYFVYKQKRYPISMTFFSGFSPYFQDQHFEENIPLFDDEDKITIDFPEQTIIDFILYCHNKSVNIDNDNCVFLNRLAKKYQVDQLFNDTNDYIDTHRSELQYHILFMNDSTDTKTLETERQISQNLLTEISNNKESLLNLPIQSLYRIINQYQTHISADQMTNPQILDFLDEYVKQKEDPKAVIVFEKANFGSMRLKYLQSLYDKYGDKLNLNYIPSESLKTILDKQNEIIQKELVIDSRIESLSREFTPKLSVIDELKQIIQRQQEEINSIRSELLEQKSSYENQINQLNIQISKLINAQNTQNRQLTSISNDLNSHIQELNNEKLPLIDRKQRELKNSIKQIKDDIQHQV